MKAEKNNIMITTRIGKRRGKGEENGEEEMVEAASLLYN